MSKKKLEEAKFLHTMAALSGEYICLECGGDMEFIDPPWDSILKCKSCGFEQDVEMYGFDDETYAELYPTLADLEGEYDEDEEDDEEYDGEKYEDEYDGFRGFDD